MTFRIPARFALAFCALAAAAAPALACRVNLPASQRIAGLHRSGHLRGVVLVRVLAAGYTAPARHDYHPWEARADVVRVLSGPRLAGPLRFRRSGSSAACDDGLAPPARGELWVLYMADYGAGETGVNLSYPLALVRQADPVMAPLVR